MSLTLAEAKELVEWTVFMLVVGFALCCWVWGMNRPERTDAEEALHDKLALIGLEHLQALPPAKALDAIIAWHVQAERDFGDTVP